MKSFTGASVLCLLLAAVGSLQTASADDPIVVDPNGIHVGADVAVPAITVGSATVLSSNRAKLTADVNPNGLATRVYFEYGKGNVLNLRTPAITVAAGLDPAKLVADLLGLEPGTSYSYRVVADNSEGTTTSSVFGFTTPLTSSGAGEPVVVNIATGAPVVNAQASKKNARCTIVGSRRSDVLRGTRKRDVICGLGGNDKIYGRGGKDLILGGSGKDREVGGRGRDRLYGNSGNDKLFSRDRKRGDYLNGGSGRDTAQIDRKDRVRSVETVVRPARRSRH
jgi:Ca2+-binding RTX toxin-like protein